MEEEEPWTWRRILFLEEQEKEDSESSWSASLSDGERMARELERGGIHDDSDLPDEVQKDVQQEGDRPADPPAIEVDLEQSALDDGNTPESGEEEEESGDAKEEEGGDGKKALILILSHLAKHLPL